MFSNYIQVLKKMKEAFASHNLPYYWNPKYNLLGKIKVEEIQGYNGRLGRIIAMIESKIENDRFVLAEVVCRFLYFLFKLIFFFSLTVLLINLIYLYFSGHK